MGNPASSNATSDLGYCVVSATDNEKIVNIVRTALSWQKNAKACVGKANCLFAGRFQLLELLGKGGFGRV